MTSESVILKKEATLLLLLTKCLMIFSDLVRLKDAEMLMLFLWQSTKDLPVPSGCSWGYLHNDISCLHLPEMRDARQSQNHYYFFLWIYLGREQHRELLDFLTQMLLYRG